MNYKFAPAVTESSKIIPFALPILPTRRFSDILLTIAVAIAAKTPYLDPSTGAFF